MKTLVTAATFVFGLAVAVALAYELWDLADREAQLDDPTHQKRVISPHNPPRRGASRYSIEQATSDRAQLNTIAFDGLAFLTGDFCSNTFIPPGKVSDYFGFQHMRDIDTAEGGHNTRFLSRIADAMLAVLTDGQRARLIDLARAQERSLDEFAYERLPLIAAFSRVLAGDVPPATTLSRHAVVAHSAHIYELDGVLAYDRARVVGGIIVSLDSQQRAALGKLEFGNSSTWGDLPPQVDKRGLSHRAHVAVMTYASEMFSWYAGSLEADTYFCPERHGMYFGSFYMKDAPAMGKPGYSISTRLTGDSGEAFLAALRDDQREQITSIVSWQRPMLEEIVRVRREIAGELRRFMTGDTADRTKVLALSRRYGELDGELSYTYATRFISVARTLAADQKQRLLALRNLDEYPCRGAYLYSDPIQAPRSIASDSLFEPVR